MTTILITGGIASGKSSVCSFLQEAGIPVYDCDSRVKAMYASNPDLVGRIEDAIGLPFSEFAMIFSDVQKRDALEKILFPELIIDIEKWKSHQNSGIAIIESATAAERPCLKCLYDKVLLIRSDLSERSSRNPKVFQRQGIQHPETIEADWIIDNNGSLEELKEKTLKLLKNITK